MAQSNDSGGLLKILLIGGAAYLAYEYFYGAAAPATTAVTTVPPAGTTSTTQPTGTSTTTTQPSQTKVPIPTAALLDAAASAAGYPAPHSFNVYQWNYFYASVVGQQPGSNWALYPSEDVNHTPLHTSTDYVAELTRYLTTNGLAGVSRSIVDSTALARRVSMYGWN